MTRRKRKSRGLWLLAMVLIAMVFLFFILMLKPVDRPYDSLEDAIELENISIPCDTVLCSAAEKHPQLEQCTDKGEYGYFCAALILGNISFCDFFTEESGVLHCKAYVLKNPELCDNSSQADFCYSDLAMNWGREDLCEKIVDTGTKAYCLAVVNSNISYCKTLDSDVECIVQIAEMEHDSSLCNNSAEPQLCKEELG